GRGAERVVWHRRRGAGQDGSGAHAHDRFRHSVHLPADSGHPALPQQRGVALCAELLGPGRRAGGQ
nr:hypothetical protein [Tanacetum cinerariifolium]